MRYPILNYNNGSNLPAVPEENCFGWSRLRNLASAAVYAAKSSGVNVRSPESYETSVGDICAAHRCATPCFSRKANRRHQHRIMAGSLTKIRRIKPSKEWRNNIENTEKLLRKVFLTSIFLGALQRRQSHRKKDNVNHVAFDGNDNHDTAIAAPMTIPTSVTTTPLKITTPPPVTTPTLLGNTCPTLPPIPALPKSTGAFAILNNEDTGHTAITQEGLGRVNAGADGPLHSTKLGLYQYAKTRSSVSKTNDACFQKTVVISPRRRRFLGGRNVDHPEDQQYWFQIWNSIVCSDLGFQWNEAKISKTLSEMAQNNRKSRPWPLSRFQKHLNNELNFLELLHDEEFLNSLASAWSIKQIPARFDPWLPFVGVLIKVYSNKSPYPEHLSQKIPSTFYWGFYGTYPEPPSDPPSCAKVDLESDVCGNVTFERREPFRKLYVESAQGYQKTLRLPKRLYLMEDETGKAFFQTSFQENPEASLTAEYAPKFVVMQRSQELVATDPRKSWQMNDFEYYLRSNSGRKLRRAIYYLQA